ncbi:MAG: SH3 domain-containing protein [Dolichospermum sp.]|uniref:SH3 domain-containing protein n=1 Tax=Microcystis flos-aquae Mf_QC_C_20070823_S10D TaxID=2486236 RepID=A0A552KH63_9CHRO|nr:MAG: SH3 domain-containing protein [Microcystis flos-aquae Mf_QC_C_20070823_S10D]TRV23717.1 MAG: SH3 domain-containing protein [Microcystis flos-aquae Mf_QC_C_20070823_S10]
MIGFNWMSGSKILLILLLASGCQSSTTLNPQASGTCANEPDRSLIDQTAPKLNVSSGDSITQTGKIKSNQGVTYQIEAQAGQTLIFKVTPLSKLCIWKLKSDFSPLKTKEIQEDGKYFLHIEALKEDTNFEAIIAIDSEVGVIPSPSITKEDPRTISPISRPSPTPFSPPPVQPSINNNTNATIVGQPGKKNIRRGPGLEYAPRHIAYPGDRVQVIKSVRNSDKFIWYHIYFPQSGADGWIAGNLLAVDGQTTYPSQPQIQPPSQPPPKASSRGTNATVSGTPGTKNMRSGAGTAYGVVGTVRTGDRLQILGSSYDRGGYQWYKVYHPQSGTTGWIAAQLISSD